MDDATNEQHTYARQWVKKAIERLRPYQDIIFATALIPRRDVTPDAMWDVLQEIFKVFAPFDATAWEAARQAETQRSVKPHDDGTLPIINFGTKKWSSWQSMVWNGLYENKSIPRVDTRQEMREIAQKAGFEPQVSATWDAIEHHCLSYDFHRFLNRPRVLETIRSSSPQELEARISLLEL